MNNFNLEYKARLVACCLMMLVTVGCFVATIVAAFQLNNGAYLLGFMTSTWVSYYIFRLLLNPKKIAPTRS